MKFPDYYGVGQASNTWIVIIKPSKATERLIAEDLRADGYDPNGSAWYDVMENVTVVAYVKAKSEEEAKKKVMPYSSYHKKGEYDVIVRRNMDPKPQKEKVHILRGQELRDFLFRIY